MIKRKEYERIAAYMKACMGDSAHDEAHIYRVLYTALNLARYEPAVNGRILIAACLLHDVGRREQFEDPSLCHAMVGGEKAFLFLTQNGWSADDASHVRRCIETHRFRAGRIPESIEAKILFDADKLDVTGALGIARTLLYQGKVADPLYTLTPEGTPSDGVSDSRPSFFHEYEHKLKNLYGQFYTARGAALAASHRAAAEAFRDSLWAELAPLYREGSDRMSQWIES